MKRGTFICLFMLVSFSLILITWNIVRGDSEFVGSESCKDCHEAQYNKFVKSIHGKKAIPGNPVNRDGCESCHGPGAQHVEKGGGKGVGLLVFGRKIDAHAKNSRCLACHDVTRDMPFWNLSKHKTMDVSCVDCHSIHSAISGKNFLKLREPDLCFNCHRNVRSQTNKQSHHPIKEGKIRCSSCHNPMGTSDVKAMIKADSINDLCYKCHAEKRGPFAFEHPPVAENCLICHEIHGSNHLKLLVRKVPLLCQSCHNVGRHPINPYTNFHQFAGPATSSKNRFFARGCLNCHGNIHGSSLSGAFIR